MAIFQGLMVFIEAKDDGGGGDNWSYKSCKAPVKSSPPTNQHPVSFTVKCYDYDLNTINTVLSRQTTNMKSHDN